MTEKNRFIRALTDEECEALLPAYINGTLGSHDLRAVQNHIAHFDNCFALYQEALELHEHLNQTPNELETLLNSSSVDKNLQLTLNNIDKLESKFVPDDNNAFSLKTIKEQWKIVPFSFRMAMFAQAVCVLLLFGVVGLLINQNYLGMNFSNQEQKIYNTLSDVNDGTLSAIDRNKHLIYRVVFHDLSTQKDMREILNSIKAQIISGPSLSGVYTVSVIRDQQQEQIILSHLRNSPWIKLAEPVRYK